MLKKHNTFMIMMMTDWINIVKMISKTILLSEVMMNMMPFCLRILPPTKTVGSVGKTFTMKFPPNQLFLPIIFFASFVQHVNFLVIARKAFFEKVKV